jgi:hypothetical protein
MEAKRNAPNAQKGLKPRYIDKPSKMRATNQQSRPWSEKLVGMC